MRQPCGRTRGKAGGVGGGRAGREIRVGRAPSHPRGNPDPPRRPVPTAPPPNAPPLTAGRVLAATLFIRSRIKSKTQLQME